jgi:hypothetical protein
MNKPRRSLEDRLAKATSDGRERRRRCCMCLDPLRPTLTKALRLINEKKAYKVTIAQLYDIVAEEDPLFRGRVGPHSFRVHLYDHEPDWRGRKREDRA